MPSAASTAPDVGVATGITVGVTGQQTRWTVSSWGAVTPWGQHDPVTLDWYVAADDRWHVPADEPTVRQSRLDGTPVVETRLRVPDGDAVQRVWAVPDGGGTVIVEFENESPMPIAVALAGPTVVTERPVADVPIRGIDLPEGAIVLPIGHRSVVRVAVPSTGRRFDPSSLGRVPPPLAVVRGWMQAVEHASRLVLPDENLVAAVVAARCDLLLEGPVDSGEDPVGFLLDVAELVRSGDPADAWLVDIVGPAERVAKAAAGRNADVTSVIAAMRGLEAARAVARHAGDRRAQNDIERTLLRLLDRHHDVDPASDVEESLAGVRRSTSVGRFVRSVERRLVDDGRLLTGGLPTSWLGSNFEVHGLPAGAATSVSFAVRWHGERPAVLWEQHGDEVVELSAVDLEPDWVTRERSGERLWPAPRRERATRPTLTVTVDPDDGGSFG